MKKKIIIAAYILTIFSFSKLNVYAQEGFVVENDKTYYYENDEKVYGFKEIDEDTFFFSYLDGSLKYGLQGMDEKVWFQDSHGKVVTNVWEIENGKKYFFGEDGYQVKGFKEIDGDLYFFSFYDGALKHGLQGMDGKTWFQDEKGKVVKNSWAEENNKKYYFGEDGYQLKGFQVIDGVKYFFSNINGALKTGWQSADGNKWYQNKNGEVVTGLQEIDGNKYYFNEEGFLQTGFIELNSKVYFFSKYNGALKYGWQGMDGKTWYQNNNGEVVTGWQTIDNKTYFFNQEGSMLKGFQIIGGVKYFFSNVNGALKQGWQSSDGKKWYQDNAGVVVTGWQTISGNKYYFDEEGYMLDGFQTIDGDEYFFSKVNGALKYGFQGMDGKIWYQTPEGKVLRVQGWQTINGLEYYFENETVYRGLREVDGKTYYFDENTFEKKYGTVSKYYYELKLDNKTGEFIKKQYIPTYYSQKDSKWGNIKYGRSTMASTGCAPTSMAMAFTSILQREIRPNYVADYLYYDTDQFNKYYSGTSGLGIIYASDKFGVKYKGLGSKEELKKALKDGKIVFAAMGNGKFATPRWNHAIIMYKYDETTNTTMPQDPLNVMNNMWTNVDQIWNEQSHDPDDLLGGYAFYSLEAK